jgi:DNA-binding transcriptional regulator GbsR (MarR family)
MEPGEDEMTDKKTTKKMLECAEEMGLFYERAGGPRMAGRLIGWLMVSDAPHFTAADLADLLQASKGSISTTTRLLEHGGMLERFTMPGDRKAYFRLRPEWWIRLFQRRAITLAQTKQMVEGWIERLDGTSASLLARLHEMRDFYAFLERELPLLLERWIADRGGEKRSTR